MMMLMMMMMMMRMMTMNHDPGDDDGIYQSISFNLKYRQHLPGKGASAL